MRPTKDPFYGHFSRVHLSLARRPATCLFRSASFVTVTMELWLISCALHLYVSFRWEFYTTPTWIGTRVWNWRRKTEISCSASITRRHFTSWRRLTPGPRVREKPLLKGRNFACKYLPRRRKWWNRIKDWIYLRIAKGEGGNRDWDGANCEIG